MPSELEKLEANKFISQVHRSQVDERRKYEWKIVFTSLTFYVLCVAAKYKDGVIFPNGSKFKLIVWLIFLLLAFFVSLFLFYLHTANNTNKKIAEKAENAIITDMLLFRLNDNTPVTNWSWPWPLGKVPSLITKLNSYWPWQVLVPWIKANLKSYWAFYCQVVILFAFAITSAVFLTSTQFETDMLHIYLYLF